MSWDIRMSQFGCKDTKYQLKYATLAALIFYIAPIWRIFKKKKNVFSFCISLTFLYFCGRNLKTRGYEQT